MEFQINRIDNQIENEQYYEQKYLKYKLKYLTLKNQLNDTEGGSSTLKDTIIDFITAMRTNYPGMIVRTKEEIEHEKNYINKNKNKLGKIFSVPEYSESTLNKMIKIVNNLTWSNLISGFINPSTDKFKYENIFTTIVDLFKTFRDNGYLNSNTLEFSIEEFSKERMIKYLYNTVKWSHYFDKISDDEIKRTDEILLKSVLDNGWVRKVVDIDRINKIRGWGSYSKKNKNK
jgi:hypothetical protein